MRNEDINIKGDARPSLASIVQAKRLCAEATAQIATFIIIEIELGYLFCHMAKTRPRDAQRTALLRNARTAYVSAEHWMWKLQMTHAQFARIAAQLELLKFTLGSLDGL